MRIALISFEFPPAVAIGGIGTYASEAARMLVDAGHDVEVFAAGATVESLRSVEGAWVHRVVAKDRTQFREAVLPAFSERHGAKPFDVAESPEIGAEALRIVETYPSLPLVVKLHTPSYLVNELGYEAPTLVQQMRFVFGALRRGRWAYLSKPHYDASADPEAALAMRADAIAAPSKAIAEKLGSDWNLSSGKTRTFPIPFRAPESLLSLELPTSIKTVGFLGRLEPRKGVIELTHSIPRVLARLPNMKFRMIGPSWPYRRGDMQSWMSSTLGSQSASVEFTGGIDRSMLADQLAKCDIVVLPSRWENFPFACWESLAAGRVVVGSSSGGMSDVIRDGIDGRLVPPYSPQKIAETLIELASDPASALRMATSGRERVMQALAPESVLPLQIACYEAAVASRKRGL